MEINTSQIPLSRHDLERELILPKRLTSELAYLAGFIAGDGNLSIRDNKSYDITCVCNFTDEKEFFDRIIAPLFSKLFNLKVNPRFEGKNTYGIRIFSKGLLFFFNKVFEIPIGSKSEKVYIPNIVLKSKILTKSFIEGFADAGFSLCLKKRYKLIAYYPVITGVSKSKKLIKQISEYLSKQNITHSTLLDYEAFDKRFNKFWKNSRIHIYGRKNVYKWMLDIGFRNPKFVEIAKEAILEIS